MMQMQPFYDACYDLQAWCPSRCWLTFGSAEVPGVSGPPVWDGLEARDENEREREDQHLGKEGILNERKKISKSFYVGQLMTYIL